jgi:hypothetical protein
VTITHAQALLIVIGDPEVLGKDEHWRIFLNYIESRKGTSDGNVYLPEYEIVGE